MMKKITTLALWGITILVLGACTMLPVNRIIGSGNVVERTYDLADFRSLGVASAFDVEVTQGDDFAVTIHTDDNMLDVLDVRVEDGTLRIGLKGGTATSGATLRAEVTMPALRGVAQSGASRVTLKDFGTQPELSASLDGASELTGAISADAVTLKLAGASRATLVGEGGLLAADLSGASFADLDEFSVESATLTLAGASDANVTVSGTLDVSASGASEVSYGGGATLGRSSLSGASTVTER